MPADFPERLELHPRVAVQSHQHRRLLSAALLLITTAVLIALALAMRPLAGRDLDWDAIAQVARKKIDADPLGACFHALTLLVVVGHFLYLFFVQMREQLVLTRAGIEFYSPLPTWVPLLPKRWSLSWSQVQAVSVRSLLPGGGPQGMALELVTRGRKHRLYPFHWVEPANLAPVSPWKLTLHAQRLSSVAVAAQIDDSPLVRYVRVALPHLKVPRATDLSRAAFAIEKNPRALAVTVVFFVLLAYALIDGAFVGRETYAQKPPFDAFVILGVAALALGALWMVRGGVPLAETVVIALLAGAAAGAAAYPGTLRLNALTDTEGLQSYQYQLAPDLELRPLVAGPPALHFPEYYDYWSQFKAGSVHAFELRYGGLGFYQINMAPIEEDMRNFYRKQQTRTTGTSR